MYIRKIRAILFILMVFVYWQCLYCNRHTTYHNKYLIVRFNFDMWLNCLVYSYLASFGFASQTETNSNSLLLWFPCEKSSMNCNLNHTNIMTQSPSPHWSLTGFRWYHFWGMLALDRNMTTTIEQRYNSWHHTLFLSCFTNYLTKMYYYNQPFILLSQSKLYFIQELM